METCGSESKEWTNIESGMGSDDNPAENDFHFGYLTVETSTETTSRSANHVESMVENHEFECVIPTFYEVIPSLREMASVVVAVALWRRVISLQNPTPKSDSTSSFNAVSEEYEKDVEKLLEYLPGPRSIREIIKVHVKPVKNEMNSWLHYYKRNVRNTCEVTWNICDLLFCAWLPNGRIDDRQSALNVLSSPRLTQVDKFKIMCRYCLEDEIKKLSANSFPSYFTKRIQFSKNALFYYWLCYVEGDLDKLPKNNNESIESFLITAFNVDTWSAIEYFWHRLNVNEQLSKVEEILNRRPEFQMQLLSKMNDFQKRHILSKIPVKIASNFWKQRAQEHCTILTWIYMRNFVNYETFKDLIRILLCECLSCEPNKSSWLVEIWNHSPDHWKNLPDIIRMIIQLHSYYYENPCGNVEFLLSIFSNFDVEKRKNILFEQGDNLVIRLEPSVIDPLIKLCLPNAEDVSEFKKHLLESHLIQDRCCDMLHDNTLHTLNRFLDYYFPDSISRTEFCIKFLSSFTIRGCPFYYLPKWIETIEFIDSNLLDTSPHLAKMFKKGLAWSFSGFCCELWSKDNETEINKMIEVVSQVLNGKEIIAFKTRALERVQTRYRWGNFDQNVIDGFLFWCCDNDEKRVREFKKSLSVDGIFDYGFDTMKWNRVLEGDVDEETVFKIFDPVNKALLWYFEDIEEVKRFKLRKVFGYCDSGVSMFRKYTQMENNIFTRNTLPWFFDGDREQIDKFREQFKNEEISEMI